MQKIKYASHRKEVLGEKTDGRKSLTCFKRTIDQLPRSSDCIGFQRFGFGNCELGIGVFGITGDAARAAAIVAVAIVIGPTIAAFATKKYF